MSEQLSISAVMALPAHVLDPFNAFWEAFPKRPNNAKAPARLAFARAMRRASITEIMDGLARYRFSPDPAFRPMAATWLNQSRWQVEHDDLTIDPYGIAEWLASLPSDGSLSALSYDIDDLRGVLIATGWEASWRGDLGPLNGWMRDGYQPDSVARVIAAAVAEFGERSSLKAFDKRVRFRAEQITGI